MRKELHNIWGKLAAKRSRDILRRSASKSLIAALKRVLRDRSLTVVEIHRQVSILSGVHLSQNRHAWAFVDKQIQKRALAGPCKKRRSSRRIKFPDFSMGNPLSEFRERKAMCREDQLSWTTTCTQRRLYLISARETFFAAIHEDQ